MGQISASVISLFGRKWPAPVARVMWPFYTAGAIVLYGVNEIATAMSFTDEFKNDPRNHLSRFKALESRLH